MKKNKLDIILCGDICPTVDTEHLFRTGNSDKLFNQTLPLLKKADLVIGNLECPLTDQPIPIKKIGPVLYSKTESINVLKESGFSILSLANNHIRDCGDDGVLNTITKCHETEITTVGAGKNLDEAKKPLIIEKNGWKIGIMAFSEQEFNTASQNRAGANFLDLFDDFTAIAQLKEQVDYLIVLYHGGIEYYEYPSPELQKKCRKMIQSGADFVSCQHSHVIGSVEAYQKGTIVYGQGNFLFGYRKESNSWNEGLILHIIIDENSTPSVELIPITALKTGGIDLMNQNDASSLMASIKTRSSLLNDAHFIESNWKKFCQQQTATYLALLFGFRRWSRFLNRLFNNKIVRFRYSKKQLSITSNLIRCEAHREVINDILKNISF